jgi:hypothetical protein
LPAVGWTVAIAPAVATPKASVSPVEAVAAATPAFAVVGSDSGRMPVSLWSPGCHCHPTGLFG